VLHRQKSFRYKKDAEAFKPQHEAATLLGAQRDYKAAGLPFVHFAEAWLESRRYEVRPRTLEGYRRGLSVHVLPMLGQRDIGAVTAEDVRQVRNLMIDKKLSASTIKSTLQVARAVFEFGIEARAISDNPAASALRRGEITPSRLGQPKFRAHFLTPAQVETLAVALAGRPPYDLMVRFLAYTGLRAGELAGLDVGDVTIRQGPHGWAGSVRIAKTRRRTADGWVESAPKTDSSERLVDLPDWLAEDLHVYLTNAHPQGDRPQAPLFPNRHRGGLTHGTPGDPDVARHGDVDWDEPVEPGAFRRNVLQPAAASVGLPARLRLHDLRHTFASIALAAGAEPFWVSTQMGHKDLAVTLTVYAKYIPNNRPNPLNGRPGAVVRLRAV